METQINIVDDKEKKTFNIMYSKQNKYTNRLNNKSFNYYYGSKSNVPTINILTAILKGILNQYDDRALFGTDKQDKTTVPPGEIKAQLTRKLKNMNRSHKGKLLLVDMENEQFNQPIPKTNELEIKKFGASSIFEPEASAKTTCFLASSFMGKTTLLVNELNKLDPKAYDRIVLFTESTSSEPLKKLNPKLDVLVFNMFVPSIVKFLKDINDTTKNRFKFMVILDDVIELKNKMFNKMILTMRNSGISTVCLIQYSKLLTPACRSSFHDIYILGLPTLDWEFILRSFLAPFMRKVLNEEGSYQKLAERTKEFINQKLILRYHQRQDKLEFYVR